MTQIPPTTAPPPTLHSTTANASQAQSADLTTEAVVAAALDSIKAASEPALLPHAWRFLGPPRYWRLAVARGVVEAELKASFPVEVLQSVGILKRGPEQELKLASAFGNGKSVFRFVVNDHGQPDVLSKRGSLRSRCAALEFAGFKFAATDKRQESALLAQTDADVQILTALGYRCLWMNGLEELTPAQAKPLFHSAAVADPRRRYWTLSGFQVATLSLSPPPLLAPVIYNFSILEMKIRQSSFNKFTTVWRPTAVDLAEIRKALDFRNPTAVRELIDQSCSRSSKALEDYEEPTILDPDMRLNVALARLRAAVGAYQLVPLLTKPVRDALAQVEVSHRSTLRSRFEAEAALVDDPLMAELLYHAAEMSEYRFNQLSVIRLARAAAAGKLIGTSAAAGDDSTEEVLRTGDQLLKIIRELRRQPR